MTKLQTLPIVLTPAILLNQIRQFSRQLPAGRRALALVWSALGWWTVILAALLVAQGLIPAGQVLLLRSLVNALVSLQGWRLVAASALGFAALWVAAKAISGALSWVRAVQAERVQDEVHRLIHDRALRMDLSFDDHPESYDLLYRAQVNAISQPLSLLENLGSVVQNGLGFLVLAGVLWTYARWMPLLLIFTALPGLMLVARLDGGFDALLGKWFGGSELSGGEWQRIAFARAFFRQASLIVLDEPTSEMGSWAEQDWLGRFRALTAGKTALMVTHRFTTAMHADAIHVLDKGRVVESGTHKELVALGGTYESSRLAQMREIGSSCL